MLDIYLDPYCCAINQLANITIYADEEIRIEYLVGEAESLVGINEYVTSMSNDGEKWSTVLMKEILF